MNNADVMLRALQDQHWEHAKEYRKDLSRLVLTGTPENDRDVLLIRKACALVIAELILRKHENPPNP